MYRHRTVDLEVQGSEFSMFHERPCCFWSRGAQKGEGGSIQELHLELIVTLFPLSSNDPYMRSFRLWARGSATQCPHACCDAEAQQNQVHAQHPEEVQEDVWWGVHR